MVIVRKKKIVAQKDSYCMQKVSCEKQGIFFLPYNKEKDERKIQLKTKETLEIEDQLRKMCRKKRLYGCEEVTIGFYNSGHGNEICDFMTMDSKGVVKCYEIKVTLADLRSHAKKSWYGHYNYLVISPDLYKKIDDWGEEIPADIGIIVHYTSEMESVRRAKKRELSVKDEIMVKESLIRSMYYKMDKYYRIADGSLLKEAKKALKSWKTAYEKERKNYLDLYEKFAEMRRKVRQYKKGTGIDIMGNE